MFALVSANGEEWGPLEGCQIIEVETMPDGDQQDEEIERVVDAPWSVLGPRMRGEFFVNPDDIITLRHPDHDVQLAVPVFRPHEDDGDI